MYSSVPSGQGAPIEATAVPAFEEARTVEAEVIETVGTRVEEDPVKQINAKNTMQTLNGPPQQQQQQEQIEPVESVQNQAQIPPATNAENTVGSNYKEGDSEIKSNDNNNSSLSQKSKDAPTQNDPASTNSFYTVFVPQTSGGIWFCRVSLVLIVLAVIIAVTLVVLLAQ